MTISIFNIFSIGIGPSSSHTVGPMKAAYDFITHKAPPNLAKSAQVKIELFGSLAFTGKGHGTDNAILMGLTGKEPNTIDPATILSRAHRIITDQTLNLGKAQKPVNFDYTRDFIFNYKDLLPAHTNGMRFSLHDANGQLLHTEIYYSIGGGFILTAEEAAHQSQEIDNSIFPYPFTTAKTLLNMCEQNHLTIAELVLANELTLASETTIRERLTQLITIMQECIQRGCVNDGILPGGLGIKRRAPELIKKLKQKGMPTSYQHADSMEWLTLYAIAVNEENAAGGRIITAPTNGAAGIIPAILHYYLTFYPQTNPDAAIEFLLTAAAIAVLYKKGASISGAEVGCQGEVGVACSMAAAGLTAILGGSLRQIENAAEIAMEHHLGMTCDPIGGLVQIPCIERNAMGVVKAVTAARLALLGDGEHYVSLDKVIATMRQTGKDMLSIYKETSQGGLAANLPEC